MLKLTKLAPLYITQNVLNAEYAVRGLIPMRADQIKKELQASKGKYPFDSLVYCNIGNPQAVKQKPLTFFRDVMALVDAPHLLDNAAITSQFPADAVARAREYTSRIGPGSGAYTPSMGLDFVREVVARYINERDRHIMPETTPDQICLVDGASAGVKMIMQLLIGGPQDAMMYPIPQYPLYTAQLTLLGGTGASYALQEHSVWGLQIEDLVKSYDDCVAKTGATPRLLVCINPGNPTGGVLDQQTMEGVLRFCHSHRLVLLADEVYQENIYVSNKRFISFREALLGMPAPYNTETMLVSLHSTSKGFIGECGRRGGYFEMINLPEAMRAQIVKLASINLCSNVNGQVMTALMCSPPRKGDASFDSYYAEYNGIRSQLQTRALMLARELNTIRGVACQPVEGAMYAFPRITLPERFAAHNAEMNTKEDRQLAVDARWALELLERSGIVVVPGSGFGQEPGTLHFRTTILPPMDEMERMVKAIRDMQEHVYEQYK